MMEEPNERVIVEANLSELRGSRRDGRIESDDVERSRGLLGLLLSPILVPYYIIRFIYKIVIKPKATTNKTE